VCFSAIQQAFFKSWTKPFFVVLQQLLQKPRSLSQPASNGPFVTSQLLLFGFRRKLLHSDWLSADQFIVYSFFAPRSQFSQSYNK